MKHLLLNPSNFLKHLSVAAALVALWLPMPVGTQEAFSVKISCSPSNCRVKLGETITLTAAIKNNVTPASTLTYRWEGPDGTIAEGSDKRTIRWTPTAVDTPESPFEGGSMFIDVAAYNNDEYASDKVEVQIDPKHGSANRPPTVTKVECKDNLLNTIPCSIDVDSGSPLSFVQLCADGTDPDGWVTGFSWTASVGSLSNSSGGCVEWYPPSRSTTARISARAIDNQGLQSLRPFYKTVVVNFQSLPDTSVAPPVVSLGCNPCTVDEGGTVTFTATATDDGRIASYEWFGNAGPEVGTFIGNTNQSRVQWQAPDLPGEYIITVLVRDDIEQEGRDEVKITVNPPAEVNRPLSVEAFCHPCTVGGSERRKVSLNAVPGNPETPLTYKWTVQGNAGILLTPEEDDTVWIPPPGSGSYRITVTVDDGQGVPASDSVVVSVQPNLSYSAPVVNAGSDISNARPLDLLILNGSVETEAPGPLIYRWTQIEGPKVTIREKNTDTDEISFQSPKVSMNTRLVFKLTVIDSWGLSGEDTVTVTVNNRPPKITWIRCEKPALGGTWTPSSCTFNPNEEFLLRWNSSDPDGDLLFLGGNRNLHYSTDLPAKLIAFATRSVHFRINKDAAPGEYDVFSTIDDLLGGVSEPVKTTITIRSPNPLNPPTGLSASDVINTALTLSWNAPGNTAVTGYQILRAVSDAETDDQDVFSVIVHNTGSTDTQYRVTGLRTQTSYKFKVKAHMEGGGLTPASDSVRVRTEARDPDETGSINLNSSSTYTYQTLNTEIADYEDRFSFTVRGQRLLDFRVYRSQIPIKVILEDSRGNILTEAWNSEDRTFKRIKMLLNSGTYTIRVSAEHGSTNYVTYFKLNTPPSLPNILVSDASANEASGAVLNFVVTLDQNPTRTVTVDYQTLSGSATAGEDYTAMSGTLTFEPGDERSQTVSVPVLTDSEQEGPETVFLQLSNPSGGNIKYYGLGRGVIGGIGISVSDAAVVEGPSATLDFVVTLDKAPRSTVTVDYTTQDGTARAGSDYTAKSGTLTFAANERSKTVSVAVLDDNLSEGTETMTLRLSNSSGAGIKDAVATGTILGVGVRVSDADAVEGPGASLDFTVRLDRAPESTVTVKYETVDGTAIAEEDYAATSGTLTFAANEQTKTVRVPVLDDNLSEGEETMTLRLFSPSGADIKDGSGTGTIRGVGIKVSDAETVEAPGATLDFVVTLGQAPESTVTVDYKTVDGTARAGQDYTAKSGTLTFAANERTKTVSVAVRTGYGNEDTETMTLQLSNSSGAAITDGSGTGTIWELGVSVADAEVEEGPSATLDFVVSLNQSPRSEVIVNYRTQDGTARAKRDYTAKSGTLAFQPGERSKTVSVAVKDDDIDEGTETLTFEIINALGASVTDNEATGSIIDKIGISVSDASAKEEAGANLDFVVRLDRAPKRGETVTVMYATVAGTASAGTDYIITDGTLTFQAGEREKTVSVPVVIDDIGEPPETLTLKLASPSSNAVLIDDTGTGTITEKPGISVSDASAKEEADATLDFTVRLNQVPDSEVTVSYTTVDGTATAGNDYTAKSGTLTFQTGEHEKTVSVAVISDATSESEETMTLKLSSPSSNAVLIDDTGTGTIIESNRIGISVADAEAVEPKVGASGSLNFVVSLDEAPGTGQTVTVSYTMVDGTARAGQDYHARSASLTFAEGEQEKTVSVVLIPDSNHDEGTETMTLELYSPSSNAVLIDGTATGTIFHTNSIRISDAKTKEKSGAALEFVVTLSQSPESTVTVDYTTQDGTATIDDDYTAASGTLTFQAGEREKIVDVLVSFSDTAEGDEIMYMGLSNPSSNAVIVDGLGVGTITESGIGISVDTVRVKEGPGATLDFKVKLDEAPDTGETVTVDYKTVDDTALAGSDYTAKSGTLTFAAGEREKTVSVNVLSDSTDEDSEFMKLRLSNPSGAVIIDSTAFGVIWELGVSVSDATVKEGPGATLDFVVSLNRVPGSRVLVLYRTSDGTAVVEEDYTATSGAVAFAADELTKTVSVPVIDDDIDEPTEILSFIIHSHSRILNIGDGLGIGTITDAVFGISVSDAKAKEDSLGATLDFVVTLDSSPGAGETVTVDYETQDGTAQSPSDYTETSGTLTFKSGERVKVVSVTVKQDLRGEDNETMTLRLSNPSAGAALVDNVGTGTITDKTDGIKVSDVTVKKASGATLDFVVSLGTAPGAGETVSVDYKTVDGTAEAGEDYTAKSGTLSFQSGERSKTVRVSVTNDTKGEVTETMFLELSNPSGADILTSTGTGTITDKIGIFFTYENIKALEGSGGVNHTLYFAVELDQIPDSDVTVNYRTLDGTATAGEDYTAKSGTLTFQKPGSNPNYYPEATVFVVLLDDDTTEGDETMTLELYSPSSNAAIISGKGRATGTITETEAEYEISVSDAVVRESTGATLDFVVSLDEAPGTGETVTVSYTTVDGTATAGSDYTAVTSSLTFAAGERKKTVSVSVTNDSVDEFPETMTLSLDNPSSNAEIIDNKGTGTITDAILISVSDAEAEEAPGATLNFVVSLDRAPGTGESVTVEYDTQFDTAQNGSDYTGRAGILTFQAGAHEKIVNVSVIDDDIDEPTETMFFVLSNPSAGALIIDNKGIGTIKNSDPMPHAWLSRFGRAVGSHAVDVISSRMSGKSSRENRLIVGGKDITPTSSGSTSGAQSSADASTSAPQSVLSAQARHSRENGNLAEKDQEITLADIMQGSSFSFSSQDETGESGWSFWGELLTSNFSGKEQDLSIEGEVRSGFIGADVTSGNVKTGLALSQSEGTGSFYKEEVGASPEHSQEGGPDEEEDKGKVKSRLTSVYPYIGYIWGEDNAVWGTVGYGEGDMTLTTPRGEVIETNISMRMGAVGANTPLMSQEEGAPLNMTLKTDGMYVQMRSEKTRGMKSSKTEVTRLRATLDTSRDFELGEGLLTPSFQLGVRKDGGDAEEGFGVETGGGLSYQRGPLSLSFEGRTLLAHEERDYKEWGASLAFRLDPGAQGRGLSFSLLPTWGNNNTSNLWEAQGIHQLSENRESGGHRLEGEIGYGFNPFERLLGIFTPYFGFSRGDNSRAYRTGTRWSIAPNADLSLELSRTKTSGEEDEALMLKGGFRW